MLILARRRQCLVHASARRKFLVDVRVLTRTRAAWLAAATSIVFVLSRSLPSGRPAGYSIIEYARIQALHMAFAERLQSGRDVLFAFGAWGFLYGGFYPASAYTPKLAELNGSHLRRNRAVDHISLMSRPSMTALRARMTVFPGRNC
jgi:hypothetical protein